MLKNFSYKHAFVSYTIVQITDNIMHIRCVKNSADILTKKELQDSQKINCQVLKNQKFKNKRKKKTKRLKLNLQNQNPRNNHKKQKNLFLNINKKKNQDLTQVLSINK